MSTRKKIEKVFSNKSVSYGFEIFCLVIIQLLLVKTTWLKILPPTNGFFLYWSKLSDNNIPYSDYYVPLPPLGIWVLGGIPRFFEDELFGEQVIALVVWIFLSVSIYSVIRQFVTAFPAFFATTLSLTVYLVQPGNITAGYFELALAFYISAVSLLIFSVKARSDAKNQTILFSGLFFACSILVKQSLLLPFVVVAIIFFLGVLIIEEKKMVWSLLTWILGFIIPLIIVGIFLQAQGSLLFAIQQIFSGGGKNIGGSPWILWAIQAFLPSQAAWPIIIISLVVWAKFAKKMSEFFPILIGLAVSSILGLNLFVSGGTDASTAPLIALPIIVGIFIYLGELKFMKLRNQTLSSTKVNILVLTFITILAVIVSWRLPNWNGEQFSYQDVSVIALAVRGSLITTGVVGILYLLSKASSSKSFSGNIRTSNSRMKLIYLLLGTASFSIVIMDAMSGGGGIESFVLSTAIGLGIFAKYLQEKLSVLSSFLVVAVILVTFVIPLSASQVRLPYNWFGIQEPALTEPRSTETIETLKHFELSSVTTKFYVNLDSFASEIIDFQKKNNLNESILIGTNIAGLAGGVLDIQTYKLNCPILWWDICPEQLSEEDFRKIQTDPPTGIIWGVVPESVIRAHEMGFRGGQISAIRKIQDWILEGINSGCYKQIGKEQMGVGSENSADWTLVAAVYVCED